MNLQKTALYGSCSAMFAHVMYAWCFMHFSVFIAMLMVLVLKMLVNMPE